MPIKQTLRNSNLVFLLLFLSLSFLSFLFYSCDPSPIPIRPVTIEITSPQDSAIVSDTIAVQFSIDQPSIITKVQFFIDDMLDTTFFKIPNEIEFITNGYESGSYHAIAVQVTTHDGRIFISDKITVKVENISKPIISATLENLQKSVTLTWNNNTQRVKGYYVKRKNGDGEYVTIADLVKDILTYKDTDLDTTKNYTYIVEAYADQDHVSSDQLSITYRTQGYSLYRSYSVPQSPDGKVAISPNADKIVVTNYFDDNFTVINVEDGAKTSLPHTEGTFGLCMSQSEGYFAIMGSHNLTVDLWDLNTLTLKNHFNANMTSFEIALNKTSDKIVVGGEPINIFSTASGSLLNNFNTGNHTTRAVKYSKDESLLLIGSNENLIKLWNISTGESVKTFTGHQGHVGSACFIKNETSIVSGSYEDNTLRIWDVASGNLLKTLDEDSGIVGISNLVNSKLAVAIANGSIFLMDEDGNVLQEFGEPLTLYSIDYNTKHELIVAYADKLVKVYKPGKGWEIL